MSGSTRHSLVRRILRMAGCTFPARARSRAANSPIETLENRQLLSATAPRKVATAPAAPASATTPVGSQSVPVALAPLGETFNLSSRPTATKTIYLDFNGHTTSGTPWNTVYTGGASFATPAFSLDADTANFSAAELIQIQRMWQRVVEDFAPFDVNVTTADPGVANLINSGAGDTRWGTRVVIGGDHNQWLNQFNGGIAFLDSFGSSTDIPCFVFSITQGNNEQVIAETISHEVGHTLGLNHDTTFSDPLGYFAGQGTSPMSWGPIMGSAYGLDVTQWSKGEYSNANNFEDDLSIITTRNGFGYRVDDHGNTRFTASQLTGKKVGATRTVAAAGVIERNTDTDWFSFYTTGGAVNLAFTGDSIAANLDISVTLYSPDGLEIMTINPALSLNATLSVVLPAGRYEVKIDGVGFGNPAVDGYSDYGSLGQYFINGTIPDTSSGTPTGGTSVISGRVVSDANNDGIINGTDAGIRGVMVYIDLDGNGVFNASVDKSALTDASGNFKFTGLRGGTYSVYQIVPSGWSQTSPVTSGQDVFVADATSTANVFIRNVRPPVLSGFGATVNYSSTAAQPILLTTSGTVNDVDSPAFNGGKLTIGLAANGNAADVLGVRNQGNAAGQIGVFGNVVRYGGKVIGTMTGGTAGSSLVITFNSSASQVAVRALIKNLTFKTAASNPSKATRTISFQMTDGFGGSSTRITKQVKVI
ncbi:Serine-aspartate repeat-containing protein F precursor [Caulifigura coniformis]|uniref:Serine-aspartate repeat-containing protein F n=1 Tax=Caulifigura coniformis TaxID=2527983 RepID=A0A517SEI1_9PLAN|nr:SdrD B-like domain-containing protein [Caulifigura coniformis]QDT54536.1 Serine-aspartate repeat-containing protein F precursor [Caulifigura coniformis]